MSKSCIAFIAVSGSRRTNAELRSAFRTVLGSAAITCSAPCDVQVGLPYILLERRPDIRAAEQQLRAANVQIGVAVGDFLTHIDAKCWQY
jgi:outer membrane protein TolC